MKPRKKNLFLDCFLGERSRDWSAEEDNELIICDGTEMYDTFLALLFALAIILKQKKAPSFASSLRNTYIQQLRKKERML